MTFKKKSVTEEVKVEEVKEQEVAATPAVQAKAEKPPVLVGLYLDGQKVRHIGSQPIDVIVKWDAKENVRDQGEYKPCPEGFPYKNSRYIPVNYKDFGNGMTRGFVVKTPEEVMLWALESERA